MYPFSSLYALFFWALMVWLTFKVVKTAKQVKQDHDLLGEILERIQALEAGGGTRQAPAQDHPTSQAEAPSVLAPPPLPDFPGTMAPPGDPSPAMEPPPWEGAVSFPTDDFPEEETAQGGEAGPTATGAKVRAAVNWEQFMGAKLFAWLGGLALFLGVAFFVKYSFEHDLISPPVRVAMGVALGLALLIGGLLLDRRRYAVSMQTLCAAAILIFYADIFAACALYHLLPNSAAFLLMVLITATAFVLAWRLDAQVVAVLGMLGGFLTPPLLSTGEDRPLALFSYIAMLDLGLLALVLIKRWGYLCLLAALATMVMQFGWVAKFFDASKIHTAQGVFCAFVVLFAAALWLAQRKEKADKYVAAGAGLLPWAALLFAFYLLAYPFREIGRSPFQVFGIVLMADAALLLTAWLRPKLRWINMAAGAVVFLLQTLWITEFLTPDLLNPALLLCLLFAVLHGAFPVLLERINPLGSPGWWGHVFAPAALLLTMIPLLKFEELSIAVWVAILLLNCLAVLLAMITRAIKGILAVLLITTALVYFWLTDIPVHMGDLLEMLVVIGAFAAFFFMVSVLILRRGDMVRTSTVPDSPTDSGPRDWMKNVLPKDLSVHIPALSGLLPFLLLILVVLKQPLENPSPVFSLAILLGGLLYSLVFFCRADLLAAVSLLGIVCLEQAWFSRGFASASALVPLLWFLLFYGLFAVFPFLFQRRMTGRVIPWAVAALAGPLQFFFVYRLVRTAYFNPYMGLLPALFSLPSMLALLRLVKTVPLDSAEGRRLAALFGGTALFFITAIFPIQFDKQWITIGWALEGTALLWLLQRVPHAGLRLVGTALLIAAFVRLALNQEVIHYHHRADTPILNWYLYAYGLVSLCLFGGAKLLKPPGHLLKDLNVQALLYSLGTVLVFLLLNIEIADYFSAGSYIQFKFSGNFGRDMTYSLAWGVFAFVLLVVGIRKGLKAVRWGGIGLLIVTILKLFLHDLWSLGGLYRIGALMGLALVLIPVSFLYQRFLGERPAEPGREKTGA